MSNIETASWALPAALTAITPSPMTAYRLIIAALLALVSTPTWAQTSAPQPAVTAAQMIRLDRVGAPTVSPDGRFVVYQVTETNEEYQRSTGLFIVDTRHDDVGIAIADLPDANESAPAFSPTGGRLYFISNKSGSDQLWFVDLTVNANGYNASAPVQASDTVAEIAGFRISPDGRRVLLTGTVEQGCPNFGCRSNSGFSRAQPGPGSARTYDELFVRHWTEWETPGTYNRTYSFALGVDGRVTGQGVDVAGALVGDTPSQPYGGVEELAFSADSGSVFFTLRIADRNESTSTNLDIYQVSATGGAATNLTETNDATDMLPSPSPDGRWLAYVAMERPGYEADRQMLMLRDLRTGLVRPLTADWDRSVGSITWSPDSRSIYFTAQHILEQPVYRIDLRDRQITRLTVAGTVNDVQALPNGSLVYSMNSILAPNDIYLRRANGDVRRMAQDDSAAPPFQMPVTYRQFNFTGANGDRVYGQILTPAGATGRLPTVLLVHGGPQGSFGNGWSWRWNPALWAAQGYAVVTIDFHGSTGYGQAFTDSINRNWGGWPLEDLRLGFAAAATESPQVDTMNACAAGASYGGYMINWMAGQWPDGFRCFINHAGILDLRAMAMTTEELWFDEWDHGGPWWSRPDAERWNPVNHVQNWRTPTLVIHGQLDFRIPYTQGLAAFTAMQRRGVESRLVMFPDEGHWIMRPRNSLQWHGEVFGWLSQHLRGRTGQ
jgi:dipeptidyl aminopeptidase/acylaminoacyl peptidase